MITILIVDDEKAIARALDLKLSHAGFSVELASDGNQAITILNTKKFDMVLLDLVMPNKDGFSVLGELKKSHPETKVIVLSNLTQVEDIKKAQSLGAHQYFIKSDISLASLVEYIKKTLQV